MPFYEQERERAAQGWKIAFAVSLVFNAALGAYFVLGRAAAPAPEPPAAREATKEQVADYLNRRSVEEIAALVAELQAKGNVPATPPATVPAATPAGEVVPAPTDAAVPGAPTAPAPAATTAPAAAYRTFCRKVTGSLYATFRATLPEKEAEWLSAYFTRVMVWNMNIQSEVHKGDEIRVLYQMDGGPETMVVPALEFRGASGKVVRAFRYKAPGDAFPRYFDENGAEIELRLQDSPIHDWEQITELFAGPRRHHGMDFKAPIGTPVRAPFDGRVVKKNWNWRANGNCLELEFPGKPFHAIFLHMDRIEDAVGVGTAVKADQPIGRVGNTGHVTAPHLHYQLEIADRPVDPMKQHATYRRTLSAAEAGPFRAATAPLLAQLAALTSP